jgi:hypothetical protein
VVQNGQTASDLQLRYNLSWHTLKTANSDKNLDALQGGDIVCIPAENIACPLPASVTLGDAETRDAWRAALVAHFEAHRAELSDDSVARLEKNPLLANTLYQVDVTISLSSWESERTHERVYKNQIRLNKINKVNLESV